MNDTVAVVIAVALLAFLAVAAFSLRDAGPVRRSEAELLALCQRDAERAERMIELELQLAPHITRAEAIHRAVARYRRDNR
jgi:hypothetical protein